MDREQALDDTSSCDDNPSQTVWSETAQAPQKRRARAERTKGCRRHRENGEATSARGAGGLAVQTETYPLSDIALRGQGPDGGLQSGRTTAL